MELLLKRTVKAQDYTIGDLYIDNVFFCNTLEDTDRGLSQTQPLSEILSKKVYGKTAIPYGAYRIDMDTVSPKFKDRSWAKPYGGKLPRLMDVKGYEGVLIHTGNKPEDTLGCILVGINKVKGSVANSTEYFHKLMTVLLNARKSGESINLKIE